MSEDVVFQMCLFVMAIIWGLLLMLAYDLLRLIRVFITHKKGVQIVEEILFWFVIGFIIYQLIACYNNGAVRNYIVFGMSIGMIFYHFVFSSFFMSMGCFIFRPIMKITKKLEIFVNHRQKALKSIVFDVKMKFNNKKGRKGWYGTKKREIIDSEVKKERKKRGT